MHKSAEQPQTWCQMHVEMIKDETSVHRVQVACSVKLQNNSMIVGGGSWVF